MSNIIDNLTNWPNQVTHIILDDGSIVDLSFRFNAATLKWVFDVKHDLLTVQNMLLCVHMNLLRQWMYKIPFGLCCITTDGLDPIRLDDFTSGRVTLIVLNSDDVVTCEKLLRAAVVE